MKKYSINYNKTIAAVVLIVLSTLGVVSYVIFSNSVGVDGFDFIDPDRMASFSDSLQERIRVAEKEVRSNPNDIEALFVLARLCHANGILDVAERIYLNILKKKELSDPAKVYYYLADISKYSGDLSQAEVYLRESIKYDGTYLTAYLGLGDVCYKTDDLSGARAAYEEALKFDPNSPYALVGLARERIQLKDDASALELLEKLVVFNPKYNNGTALLAQVLDRNGEKERANTIRELNMTGWDVPPEDPWMDDVLVYCYNTQRLSILFEDYKRIGEIDKAMSFLDRIEKIDPLNWNVHMLRGYAFVELGKYREAVPSYLKALEMGGDPVALYSQLAKTYFELKKYEEAEEAALNGMRLSENNSEVFVTMANILMKKGDVSNAIKLFEKVIKIDPYDQYANTVLAKFYWQSGSEGKAVQYLKAIKQIAQNDMFSRVFLGSYYLNENRPEEALPSLEQAYGIDSTDLKVVVMLADALSRIGLEDELEGNLLKAKENYERALLVMPDSIEAKEGLARLLAKDVSGLFD